MSFLLLTFKHCVPVLNKCVKRCCRNTFYSFVKETWGKAKPKTVVYLTAMLVWLSCLGWSVILIVLDMKTFVSGCTLNVMCTLAMGHWALWTQPSICELFSVGGKSYGLGILILLWREPNCKSGNLSAKAKLKPACTLFKDHGHLLGVSRGEWSYSRHSLQALIKFSIPLHSLRNTG